MARVRYVFGGGGGTKGADTELEDDGGAVAVGSVRCADVENASAESGHAVTDGDIVQPQRPLIFDATSMASTAIHIGQGAPGDGNRTDGRQENDAGIVAADGEAGGAWVGNSQVVEDRQPAAR